MRTNIKFDDLLKSHPDFNQKGYENLVHLLTEQELGDIGTYVCERAKIDEKSMSEWAEVARKGFDMMDLFAPPSYQPWDGAANVKYPLVVQASHTWTSQILEHMHSSPQPFKAVKRLLPESMQAQMNQQVNMTENTAEGGGVNTQVAPQGKLDPFVSRALRVTYALNYMLLLDPQATWLDMWQRTYPFLSVAGTAFHKVYYDVATQRPEIQRVDALVHNESCSLAKAPAITHEYSVSYEDIVSKVLQEIYVPDKEIKDMMENPSIVTSPYNMQHMDDVNNPYDKAFVVYESIIQLDLDGDGYPEPYLAVVNKETRHVYQLIFLADLEKSIIKDGKPVKLVPESYYVDMHFMRDPKGGLLSHGFGLLLGSINEYLNNTANLIQNTASLATAGGGITGMRSGRGLQGRKRIKLNELNYVNAFSSDNDVGKAVKMFDTKEPSPVLLQMFDKMLAAGEKLGMVTDLLTGDTTMGHVTSDNLLAMLDQSLKPLKAIHQRIYSALNKEVAIMCRLIRRHMPNAVYANILGVDENMVDVFYDFNMSDMGVTINADPNTASNAEKQAKLSILRNLAQDPHVNNKKIIYEAMQALGYTSAEIGQLGPGQETFLVDPPPPPPSVEEIKAKDAKDIADKQLQLETLREQHKHEIAMKEHQVSTAQLNANISRVATQNAKDLAQAAKSLSDADKKQQLEVVTGNADEYVRTAETLNQGDTNV